MTAFRANEIIRFGVGRATLLFLRLELAAAVAGAQIAGAEAVEETGCHEERLSGDIWVLGRGLDVRHGSGVCARSLIQAPH